MNKKSLLGLASALGLGALALPAQEATEIEKLKQQLRQTTENFEKSMQEQRRIIDDLNRRLDQVQRGAAATNVAATGAGPVTASATAAPPAKAWSPNDPIRLGKGSAYMDVGLIGTFAAGGSTASDIEGGTQLGGHDPNQRGFSVQGVELSLRGAVDPYFRGAVNLTYGLDAGGESVFELEEAWLETMSLPWNLEVRAGQILTAFGRHNPTHLHSWSFVDAPLVNARFLGPDGLRNPGARLGWLMPVKFYSELTLGVQDSQGETAASFRSEGGHHDEEAAAEAPFAYRHGDNDRGVENLGDLLFTPRYAVSFELTESQTLLAGVSAAFGPNSRGGESAGSTDTRIYGLDLTWKWRSPRHHGGFPFVSWQSEVMLRQYEAGAFDWADEGAATDPDIVLEAGAPANLPGETLTDYGFYSQALWGFRKGWVAGLRGEFVSSDPGDYEGLDLTFNGEPLGRDPQRAQRWRLSPNLTWYPSEFSKIRLQYNYDNRSGIGEDHSVWLQFEFILGAHAAHQF